MNKDQLFQVLDQDWVTCDRCITGLITPDKSIDAIVQDWVNRTIGSSLPQPDNWFWWDFSKDPDTDKFFNALLRQLKPGTHQPLRLISKISSIQSIINNSRSRYLLVLHGVEALQHKEGDDYGLFVDLAFKEWLRDFAENDHCSFCLITSSVHLLDLIDYGTYTNREINASEIQ